MHVQYFIQIRPMHAVSPEAIHPSLWRASQLARRAGDGACLDTGYPALSAELPGGGWPLGCLIELLVARPGIGELRLLQPVLHRLSPWRDTPPSRGGRRQDRRSVLLIQPPHCLQPLALTGWGVDPGHFLMVRASTMSDACWAAQQALQAGTCKLVLLWPLASPSNNPDSTCKRVRSGVPSHGPAIRFGMLRRLNLAAQAGSALFFLLRPAADADQSSPAPLRLALHPAPDGLRITFIKRQGPHRDDPLFVALKPSAILLDHHVRLDRRLPAFDPAATARLRAAALHA